MPYTFGYIGATSQYPIYDYINLIDSNSSNFIMTQINSSSNFLEQYSSNFTINTANILQTQITNTCNLIYKDGNLNTVIRQWATFFLNLGRLPKAPKKFLKLPKCS